MKYTIGRSRHLKTRHRCLNCDKLLDGCTGIRPEGKKDAGPAVGDMTVCAYCQHLHVFDERLRFRNPTFVEMAEIANDPRVLMIKPMLKKAFR